MTDPITAFYLAHLPGAELSHTILSAPCPFCAGADSETSGTLAVILNRESFFHGYFRCQNRCTSGGFPLHFARLLGLKPSLVPGYDPDRETGSAIDFPAKNLNQEVSGFCDKLAGEELELFRSAGIGQEVLTELCVGYNGRYLVYPYLQADGNSYAARCVHPQRPEDFFWYGDERFFAEPFRLFNAPEIDRCENGTLFVVEGEQNLLPLKQLGLPGVAVPSAAELDHLDPQRFAWIRTLFLLVNHSAESEAMARAFATRAGFKVRLVRWPEDSARNTSLFQLAVDTGPQLHKTLSTLIKEARAFSPFPSPAGEFHAFTGRLARESGEAYASLTTGFPLLDRALDGLHGINIIGGTPKAGKSAFAIQIASGMAQRKVPVIYYDFENGRQKIYLRILARTSRLALERIKGGKLTDEERSRLQAAEQQLRATLSWLRVVNDRRLSPETMRRHVDFIRHECNSDYAVVVIDSLHKLPFADISQKRSGIDGWLRQLEAIRDELAVSFLVISELERNPEGHYDRQPHLGSFKGSGDIGYSADNALVFLPRWDPFANEPPESRRGELWLVASREQTPGLVATYRLDYPFWGFIEE